MMRKNKRCSTTLGVTAEAQEFCDHHALWHPIMEASLLRTVRAELTAGKSGAQIVEVLNQNHRLRHTYRRGQPRWTLQELSRTVKLVNNGRGLKEIKDRIWNKQETSFNDEEWDLGAMDWVKGPVADPADENYIPQLAKDEIVLQKIHQDGTCTIGITRLVKQFTTETVPITDPRVVNILRDRLNSNN